MVLLWRQSVQLVSQAADLCTGMQAVQTATAAAKWTINQSPNHPPSPPILERLLVTAPYKFLQIVTHTIIL